MNDDRLREIQTMLAEARRRLCPPEQDGAENERLDELAHAYVESQVPMRDIMVGVSPAWYGWALRAAWLAGYRVAQADQAKQQEGPCS